MGSLEWILPSQKVRALLAARCCFEVTYSVNRRGFCEPHFEAKARVFPLGSPSVRNMLAPLLSDACLLLHMEKTSLCYCK